MNLLLEQFVPNPVFRPLVGSLIIIALTLLGSFIVKNLILGIVTRLTSATKSDLDDRLVKASGKYIYWLSFVFGGAILSNFVESYTALWLGEQFFVVIDGIIYSAGVLVVAGLLTSALVATLQWYGEHIADRTATRLDEQFVPLVSRIGRIVIGMIALLTILDHFAVDVKGLIAVLGVGSLGIALAAQDTIANMIGGFVIMIDRPFRIGDRLLMPNGSVCIVRQIGLRSTRLLTFDNTLIITPNAELVKSTIHNLSYPEPEIRVVVSIGVAYDSDIDRVRRCMLDIAASHPKVLESTKPEVHLVKLSDSAMEVTLYCRVGNFTEQFDTGNELRETLVKRFRTEGIVIPYPQRVVHLPAAKPTHN